MISNNIKGGRCTLDKSQRNLYIFLEYLKEGFVKLDKYQLAFFNESTTLKYN